MLLSEESCKNFSELLASKSPVPGGGGAAALVGALGAALCSMAGNFTVGKKKYADVENDILRILDRTEKLRSELLSLIDEDAKSFEPLSEAYKIPKEDSRRKEIFESASLKACEAAVKIVSCCSELVDLLDEMLVKGSRMLISDTACGALLCRAAMESAAVNIFINTSAIKGNEKAKEIELKIDSTLKEYCPKASRIAEKAQEIIRK